MGIVYVHGILATPQSTWRDLPQQVLQLAGVDVDVFAFAYPSFPWQRASIEEAAGLLSEALKTTNDAPFVGVPNDGSAKSGYSRLIFVAHSNGGLVLKRYLLNESHKVEETKGSLGELDRATDLVNFAVPHSGGTLLLSCLLPLAMLGEGIFGLLGCFDWRSDTFNLGMNRIYRQIRWRSAYLKCLEKDFSRLLEMSKNLCRPFPISHDYAARSDLAVYQPNLIDSGNDKKTGFRRLSAEQRRHAVLRGTHITVKISRENDSVVVRELAKIVLSRAREQRLAVPLQVAIHESLVKDVRYGVQRLLGAAGERPS